MPKITILLNENACVLSWPTLEQCVYCKNFKNNYWDDPTCSVDDIPVEPNDKCPMKLSNEQCSMLSKEEIEKFITWKKDYNYISWNEFKTWNYCERCKSYDSGQCICYAR